MKRNAFFSIAAVAVAMLSIATLASCSDDDTPEINDGEQKEIGTDGNIKIFDNIVFAQNTIGNGDQEVIFKGKQTIKKGTYLLKGWVYVAEGAELTIEPGTVSRATKTPKLRLSLSRVPNFSPKVLLPNLSCLLQRCLPDSVVPATGVD